MIRILWYPELSSWNKQTDKVILSADSNGLVLYGFLKFFDKDTTVTVILPDTDRIYDCDDIVYKTIEEKARFIIDIDMFPNSFAQRYTFDFVKLYNLIDLKNYDVLINNEISLTRNWRALQLAQKADKLKIISWFHFVVFPNDLKVDANINYWYRELDGMLVSDAIFFQGKAVKDEVIKYLERNYKNLAKVIRDKCYNVNFVYSYEDIMEHKIKKSYEKIIIIIPNRISIATRYSSHDLFIKVLNILAKKYDFEVWFTNITQSVSTGELKNVCKFKFKNLSESRVLNRTEYYKKLWEANIVLVGLQDLHGGASLREAMAAKCLPIMPYMYEYKNLMPKTYFGYYNFNVNSLKQSLEKTFEFIKKSSREKIENLCTVVSTAAFKNCSFEKYANVVKRTLYNII